MKKALLALFFALLGVANAYAEDQTVVVGVKDAGKPLVLPTPKAGENLTVIVEVPVPTKKVAPAATAAPPTRVVEKESGVSLRGGIGFGYAQLLGNEGGGLAITTDTVGQIGFRSSPWRVRARAGFGSGRYDTLAVAGSVAATYYVVPEMLAVGLGWDMLGTINKGSHPRETWNEQFYGPSFRVVVERAGLSFEWFVLAGVRETRAPGDTPEEYAVTTSFNLSYLWGR